MGYFAIMLAIFAVNSPGHGGWFGIPALIFGAMAFFKDVFD